MNTFGEQILTTIKLGKFVHRHLIHKLRKSSPHKGLILQNHAFSQTFYSNLPTNLHGYICHIRDILRLCAFAFNIIAIEFEILAKIG